MKIMKWSSILLLAVLFIGAFIPEASARHCRTRSSFGLSFNVNPSPAYVVAPAPAPVVAAPAPVMVPSYGYGYYAEPAPAYYAAPAPAYYAPAPVVVERAPRVYVQQQPGFGFSYSRWRR